MDGKESKRTNIPPNQTIYIRNINEKLPKKFLRSSLYAAFSPYGRIIDIVALKTIPARGQAFIAFEDVSSATLALTNMQAFDFFGKPLVIHYAKSKSDRVAILDGSYVVPERRKASRQEQDLKKIVDHSKDGTKKIKSEIEMVSDGDPGNEKFQNKLSSGAEGKKEVKEDEEETPPNKILFVENLPADLDKETIDDLFQQFDGFVEARMATQGRAFIEFEKEDDAAVALTGLQGFAISDGHSMAISYAKK